MDALKDFLLGAVMASLVIGLAWVALDDYRLTLRKGAAE